MEQATATARHGEYLERQRAACAAREQALRASGREDEGVHARIEGNVYGIFAALLRAAQAAGGELAAGYERLGRKTSAPWREKCEHAAAAGRADEAHIERVKIEAAERILAQFAALCREE